MPKDDRTPGEGIIDIFLSKYIIYLRPFSVGEDCREFLG
jgi:hypothetical protein